MFEYKDYIYAVYKERSFSKAADKLFVSQPTLSLMVRKAERLLGQPVFNRRTTPVSLTPFGVEYILAIEQIHRLEGELHQFLDNQQTLQSGSLRVGGNNFGVNYIVPQKLAAFHKSYPNINLKIVDMNTMQGKHGLDSGELDFVITNHSYDPQKYEQKICYSECLVLAVPSSFPINESLSDKRLKHSELGEIIFGLPQNKAVSLREFNSVPFILLSNANYLRECTNLLFRECQQTPRVILEMEQSFVSYNFTQMGIGATILSNRLLEHRDANDDVCFYKIDSEHIVRDAYISYRKGVYFTYAMKKFMEKILENIETIQ